MQTLQEYLEEHVEVAELASVLFSVAEGMRHISAALNVSDTGKAGTENVFGEEQLALDVLSDKIMQKKMMENQYVGLVGSEEQPDEVKVGDGEYAVCYDPLDGSSLVDVNLAVGTIVGVYKAHSFIGLKGDDQLAALIGVFGPSTTILLTFKRGVVKFILDPSGHFLLCHENFEIVEGKMFAPGNLRACKNNKAYLDLVNYWIKEQYTLRYSGGMVPDVNQILVKGKGIFSYPGYDEAPDGKLRLLYECAPMALLVEQAGGRASDGKNRILEKEIKSIDQRTPIFIGSKGEVRRCEDFLA